ncbi:SDR family oxidoreductase [Salmonella enterica]
MTDSAFKHPNNLTDSPLKDKYILIFGGSSGIGLEAAIQARDAGANVTIVGSDATKSQYLAELHGLNWLAADVTNEASIKQALKFVGHIDHLVLLAGTFGLNKVMDTDIAILRRIVDERLFAAITIISTLGDRLAENGSITLVSGVATHRPTPHGSAVIAAACAAVETFGRHMALELAPRRVNTLSPGPIDTPLLDKAFGHERDHFVSGLKAQIPVGRIGSSAEAGAAVIFLINNAFMNGTVLHLDGGMSLT